MSPRSTRPLLAALMALLLLGACAGHRDPTGYGKTTERNFSKGCLETAKKQDTVSDPKQYCTCSYAKIIKQISFDDFKKFNSDLSDTPDSLPKPLQAIATTCAQSSR
ncbi:MAG: hypothetical protein JO291_15855 [Acidimicrobiia bacterium]|nr:hypothetical protein [Acidimicrobiia bacterium]